MQQVALSGFYERSRAARKILVVDLGFLGDSVHLVPALWEIKRHYPTAELHTLSAPIGAELLQLAPCVDGPWAFPLGSPSPPWWRHWDLLLALRRERFDAAFNFSGADRTLFVMALAGAQWNVAVAGGRKHFWSTWLVRDQVPRPSSELPVYEQRRQALAVCGLELAAPRWDLRLPETAVRWAEARVPAGAIHFSTNASTPLKEWPLEHWIELAKRLLARESSARIIATGSANVREQERLRSLAAGVADNRLTLLPSGMTIAELAAALQRCRLHVGADSGVLHLAKALGVPTFALFRDYAGTSEWLPHGQPHKHLLAPCPCANSRKPPCAATGRALCLARIMPEQVMVLLGRTD
ncbi:MAG: glycosyltransferase family 9 protein [Limisphaerales bacterium]